MKKFFLVLCAVIIIPCGLMAKNDEYKDGLTKYSAKKYSEALVIFNKLDLKNNIDAQYYLGLMYKQGTGVEVNIEKAKYYWGKAADKGHVLATFHLKKLNEDSSD